MTTPTVEEIEKVSKLIEDARTAVVTTVSAEGQLVSRPLAMQEREFDGTLWFFTQDPSPKTAEVAANDQVNVAL
jgi:general stress protein 26